jgi:phosphopantetheine--protein transferase-like protein
MVIGIGTDILKIDRICNTCKDDDSFIQRVYTEKERVQAKERPDAVVYYATRFAGKEAVFKTLGQNANWLRFNEIEILNLPDGQPQVTLIGELKLLAERKGIKSILISLSYDTDYAIAIAQAIT